MRQDPPLVIVFMGRDPGSAQNPDQSIQRGRAEHTMAATIPIEEEGSDDEDTLPHGDPSVRVAWKFGLVTIVLVVIVFAWLYAHYEHPSLLLPNEYVVVALCITTIGLIILVFSLGSIVCDIVKWPGAPVAAAAPARAAPAEAS